MNLTEYYMEKHALLEQAGKVILGQGASHMKAGIEAAKAAPGFLGKAKAVGTGAVNAVKNMGAKRQLIAGGSLAGGAGYMLGKRNA